jgi:hypothetical protein
MADLHNIAFNHDQLVYLIAKTGSRKSAIMLRVGSLQWGLTLLMILLVGLGSNQVLKSHNNDNYIESYHLDEHRGLDGRVLRDRLLLITDEEGTHESIFLYSSPQSLQVGTFWVECLTILASQDLIRLMVIDKTHYVAQDGRRFRLKFLAAMKTLKKLFEKQ